MDDVMRVVAEGYHDLAIQDDDREPLHPAVAWELCTDGVCVTARAALAAEAARTEVAEPTCPDGCGCKWPDLEGIEAGATDADRRDCACGGPCQYDSWEEFYEDNPERRPSRARTEVAEPGDEEEPEPFEDGWTREEGIVYDRAGQPHYPAATAGREPLDALREAADDVIDSWHHQRYTEDMQGPMERLISVRAALDTPDPGAP